MGRGAGGHGDEQETEGAGGGGSSTAAAAVASSASSSETSYGPAAGQMPLGTAQLSMSSDAGAVQRLTLRLPRCMLAASALHKSCNKQAVQHVWCRN